jgi:hypothetical protein
LNDGAPVTVSVTNESGVTLASVRCEWSSAGAASSSGRNDDDDGDGHAPVAAASVPVEDLFRLYRLTIKKYKLLDVNATAAVDALCARLELQILAAVAARRDAAWKLVEPELAALDEASKAALADKAQRRLEQVRAKNSLVLIVHA